MLIEAALILALLGQVAPAESADEVPYLHIYQIQDLELVAPLYTDSVELDLNAALRHTGSPFRENVNSGRPPVEHNGQEIIRIIYDIIGPDFPDGTTITYYKGNLLVKAPKSIHDQIR